MKIRTRAAHLGVIVVGVITYRVTYHKGWLQFRAFGSRGDHVPDVIAISEVFRLASAQKIFGFVPVI